MSLEYPAGAWAAAPMQPLHLIDEISHRVVNDYTEVIRALGLAAAAAPDAGAQVALTSAAIRLRAQVEAHRALQAPVGEGPMHLGDYVGRLCAALARAWLAGNGVRLRVTADEVWLDAGRCWRVGLIIAELVRNAARHGLAGGAGAIWVAVEDAAGRIRCSVCDDGEGAPGLRAGRGRRVVQALAGDLGGSVDWSFGAAGCCAVLEFGHAPPGPVPGSQATRLRHRQGVAP